MQQWDYKIIGVGGNVQAARHILETQMSNLGRDGWELVNVTDGNAFFKRPVQPPMIGRSLPEGVPTNGAAGR